MFAILAVFIVIIVLALATAALMLNDKNEPATPHANLTRMLSGQGFEFMFINVTGTIHWDGLEILLTSFEHDGDGEILETAVWTVLEGSLQATPAPTGAVPITWQGPSCNLNGMNLTFAATDRLGNGLVESGDFFEIRTGDFPGGFTPGYTYSVEVDGNHYGNNEFGSLVVFTFDQW
jgi:hypothetical protein